jgi:hypothetical protein
MKIQNWGKTTNENEARKDKIQEAESQEKH